MTKKIHPYLQRTTYNPQYASMLIMPSGGGHLVPFQTICVSYNPPHVLKTVNLSGNNGIKDNYTMRQPLQCQLTAALAKAIKILTPVQKSTSPILASVDV